MGLRACASAQSVSISARCTASHSRTIDRARCGSPPRIDRTVKRNQGFMFAIDSVEMSRRMLASVHVDDDTEKAGDLRHGAPRNEGLPKL